MGNIIKLTESDLMNIVKKAISEQQKQTAAFTAGQNLGQGIKNTGNQAVSTVQKAGQAVGQGVKNVTLQTVQIGKSSVISHLVIDINH